MKKRIGFMLVFLFVCISILMAGALPESGWIDLGNGSGKGSAPDIIIQEVKDDSLILELRLDGFAVYQEEEEGIQYTRISVPDTISLQDIGKAELPQLGRLIQLPFNSEYRVRIIDRETVTFEDVLVYPTQQMPSRSNPGFRYPFFQDREFYSGDEVYPKDIVTLGDSGVFRDIYISRLGIHPFQYNPKTRRLDVHKSITIAVDIYQGKDSYLFNNEGISYTFHNLYDKTVINYEHYSRSARIEAESMLVLVSDPLDSAVAPLLDWKNSKGIKVHKVMMSGIQNTTAGIKTVIQNAYDNFTPKPSYVLLVGHSNTIVPNFRSTQYGNAASDYPYTLLDGDQYPDILIGRILANNTTQVDVQVSKIVNYEQNPYLGTQGAFYSKAFGIASNEGSNPSDEDYINQTAGYLLGGTYSHYDYFFQRLGNATSANISSAINDGRTWVSYIGHGSGTSWGNTNTTFDNTTVKNLANGFKLPILIDVACLNGQFDKLSECFGEAWMWAGTAQNPKGAVGYYGGSVSISWHPPAVMMRGIAKQHFEDPVYTFGGSCLAGQMYLVSQMGWDQYTEDNFEWYNIFGDPSLMIRTDNPAVLDVDHPAVIPAGSTSASVSVQTSGSPFEGALVCIHAVNNPDTYASAFTNASGTASLTFDNAVFPADDLQITVTGYNTSTYTASIITDMDGVFPPSNFAASAVSGTQINLSWQKNQDNDSVMVTWSYDGVFGSPTDGTAYNPGASIPGGGTVLYRGGNTSFSHTGLDPSTAYYYRAFSYDGTNTYSSGVNANAGTLCGVYDTLPFSENFNASSELPICWEIVDNQGNGQIWQIGTVANGLSGTTGNYAYLDSDGFGSGNTQNSDLITPVFDFSSYENVSLSFTHYFRQYQSVSTATLSYTINNGATWNQIQQWTATTDNPAYFSQVIPAVAGQSQVRFKWNYTGSWGYYWCVDDVLIDGDSIGVTYAVALHADPPDLGIELIGQGNYAQGAVVNIEALTDSYTFVEWTGASGDVALLGNPSSSVTFFTMPARNVSFTAVFEERDPAGDPKAVISLNETSVKGIWLWSYDEGKSQNINSRESSWERILEGNIADKLLAADIAGNDRLEIIASIPGQGLWYYDIQNMQWNIILNNSAGCSEFTAAKTTAEGPVQLIASIGANGIYKWTFNGSWTLIHNMPADLLSAADINRDPNSIDELIVVFSDYDGFFLYDFVSSIFTNVLTISPSQVIAGDITGDGYNEMVCVFDGYGVYLVRYLPAKNESMKTIAEKQGIFDLINDIPQNSKWVSKREDGRGFQFSRITWGTPDPGHHIAVADIASPTAKEVILTYQNKTYYYTYGSKGWSTLLNAPLKRIISGNFTNGVKEDLIVCETTSGSVYLRKSAVGAWELLAAYGDSNSMAALE